MALNRVDLPTFGSPTIPAVNDMKIFLSTFRSDSIWLLRILSVFGWDRAADFSSSINRLDLFEMDVQSETDYSSGL